MVDSDRDKLSSGSDVADLSEQSENPVSLFGLEDDVCVQSL